MPFSKRGRPRARQGHRLKAAAAFLLGLSLTTNVVYVFRIGNTCVYVAYAIALLVTVAFMFHDRARGGMWLGSVDRSVWVFAGLAALSLATSTVLAAAGSVPQDTPAVVLKGLVVLACGLAVYYSVVRLSNMRGCLVAGLALGIAFNGAVSLLQQAAFDSGSFFTLYSLFPQDSFSISAKYEAWVSLPSGAGRIGSFRPQGLFLETSHLMVFLVCFAPFVFLSLKSVAARLAILACAAYCCFTSLSPNAVFLVVEAVIIVAAAIGDAGPRRLAGVRFNPAAVLMVLALLVVGVLLLLRSPGAISGAADSLARSFADLNVSSSSDEGTIERWGSMTKVLAALPLFPLGSGWNTEGGVLMYLYGSSDVASHSFAIRLALEVGVIGLASYVYVIVRHARCIRGAAGNLRAFSLGLGVVFLFVCQVTNGTAMVPWVWALLGLAQAELVAREREGAHVG